MPALATSPIETRQPSACNAGQAPRPERRAGRVGTTQRTFGFDVETIAGVGRTIIARTARAARERIVALKAENRRGGAVSADAIECARRTRLSVQAQTESVVRRLAEALHDASANVLEAGGNRTDLARLGTIARRAIVRVTGETRRHVATIDDLLDRMGVPVAA